MDQGVADLPVGWSIASASLSDLDHLCRLGREAFPSGAWSEAAWASLLADVGRRAAVTLLRQGNLLVGYSAGVWTADEAELAALAVQSTLRRRGFGSRLLAAWLASLPAGIARVHLEVRAADAATQRLYTRFGFAVAGIRRDYYQGPADDAVVMTLFKPQPAAPPPALS